MKKGERGASSHKSRGAQGGRASCTMNKRMQLPYTCIHTYIPHRFAIEAGGASVNSISTSFVLCNQTTTCQKKALDTTGVTAGLFVHVPSLQAPMDYHTAPATTLVRRSHSS